MGDIIFLGPLGFFYFYPTWYACHYRPDHWLAIFLINLLLGWTVIGWFGLMIWARWSYGRGVRKEEAREQAHRDLEEGLRRRFKAVQARIAARPDKLATFADLDEMGETLLEQIDHFWNDDPVPTWELAARQAEKERHARMSAKMDEIVERELPALATRYGQLLRIRANGTVDDTRARALVKPFVEDMVLPELRSQSEGLDEAGERFVRSWLLDEDSMLLLDIQCMLDGRPAPDGLNRAGSAAEVEAHYRAALTGCGWEVAEGADVRGDAVNLRATRDGVRLLLQCRMSSTQAGIDAIEEIRVAHQLEPADLLAIITSGNYASDSRAFARKHGVQLLQAPMFRAFAAGYVPIRGFPFEHLLVEKLSADAARCVKTLALAGWISKASDPDDHDVVVVRAEHNRARMIILCKCDNHAVGRAVVEQAAALAGAEQGAIAAVLVASENNFTRVARDAAIKRDVTMLDWDNLAEFAA